MKPLIPLFLYACMGALEVVGDVLCKKWALSNEFRYLFLALTLYIFGALLFAFSLKFYELSTAIIVFSAVNILIVVYVGHYSFSEEIDSVKITMLILLFVVIGLQIYDSLRT